MKSGVDMEIKANAELDKSLLERFKEIDDKGYDYDELA